MDAIKEKWQGERKGFEETYEKALSKDMSLEASLEAVQTALDMLEEYSYCFQSIAEGEEKGEYETYKAALLSKQFVSRLEQKIASLISIKEEDPATWDETTWSTRSNAVKAVSDELETHKEELDPEKYAEYHSGLTDLQLIVRCKEFARQIGLITEEEAAIAETKSLTKEQRTEIIAMIENAAGFEGALWELTRREEIAPEISEETMEGATALHEQFLSLRADTF